MVFIGLLSVIILVICLTYAQLKWGPDYTKTFSRLIAQKQSSIIYYFIVFFVFLSVFSVFMVTSFIPRLALPDLFTGVYFLGVIAQLVCITVPETGGRKTTIHLSAAGVLSVSVFIQIALLVFLIDLSLLSLVVCALSLSVMLLILLAVTFKHRVTKYELGLQSLYFASYLGAIMFVSYA